MKNQQLNLADYLDSTYLKTAEQAGISALAQFMMQFNQNLLA